MPTRKLIALALGCGLLILLAGGAQLAVLSRRNDTASVLQPGVEARVAGRVVSALRLSRVQGQVRLRVSADKTDHPETGWSLRLAGARNVEALTTLTCSDESATRQFCDLSFADIPEPIGTSVIVNFHVDKDSAAWTLDLTSTQA